MSNGPSDRTTRIGGLGRTLTLLLQYAIVLLAVIVVNFALPRIAPGSPVDYLAPPEVGPVDPVEIEAMLSRFDLEGSGWQQFGAYMNNLMHGDLGISVRDGRPVTEVIGDRLGWSLLLSGTAVVLSTVLGVWLGFTAGWRRSSRRDISLLTGVLAVDALPAFFVGLMMMLTFSVKLGWFPVYGAFAAEDLRGWAWIADVGQRLVMPAITLTLVGIGSVFVVARSAMISELGEDYVFMARAKGLSDREVRRHASRNARIPVSTVALLGFSTLIGASTVVETVFSYPGLGSLAFAAVRSRDYPLLQAIFLLLAVIAITVNLLNDLLYPLLDPRVRRAGT